MDSIGIEGYPVGAVVAQEAVWFANNIVKSFNEFRETVAKECQNGTEQP